MPVRKIEHGPQGRKWPFLLLIQMTEYKAIKVLPKTKAILDTIFPESVSYDRAVKLLAYHYILSRQTQDNGRRSDSK